MEAGHYESMMYLRLWKGDLPGALQLATEKGQLNDHLVSLAPMGQCSFSHSHTHRPYPVDSLCIIVPLFIVQTLSRPASVSRVSDWNSFFPGPSSWFSGVGQDSRGLREAAVYAGAVPQSRLAPRVH